MSKLPWLRVAFWLAIGVAIATGVTLSWRHYTSLLSERDALQDKVATLSKDLSAERGKSEALQGAINGWVSAAERQADALERFTVAQKKAADYQGKLLNVLSRHNLGELASQKPALIERRVNDGSSRVIRMLEQATNPSAAGAIDVPANVPAGSDTAGPNRR